MKTFVVEIRAKFETLITRYLDDTKGVIVIEFALCALLFITALLGITELTYAYKSKIATTEYGESIARAISHVPEYDKKLRDALFIYCTVERNHNVKFDIEIVVGTMQSGTPHVDWRHLPCRTKSSHFSALTDADIKKRLNKETIKSGEAFVLVKSQIYEQALEKSIFFRTKNLRTFTHIDVEYPRIARTIIWTNKNLYPIDTYEY